MKISLNWIKELLGQKDSLQNKTPQELANILLHLGLEVSEVNHHSGCSGIVVAEILAIEPHPNADRLRIVELTDGKETTKVVCGASNVEIGKKVFWAKIGSVIADGTKIKLGKLRGIESPGMLCSADELGLGSNHDGLWILPQETKTGSRIEDLLQLEDTIFSVELTPNRPDCLSHIGIARELSAVLSLNKIESPSVKNNHYDDLHMLSVSVQDSKDCPRYIAKLFNNVKVAPSPLWIQARLIRCGIRPINNVVDITNYVLLETGQPLHAFDADLLEGKKIVVRRALEGESILALDGKTYDLNSEMLIIADAKKPVAIAGIMGGEETSVTEKTKNILLESAIFRRGLVRKTKNILNLSSESSYRFERGVSRWSSWQGSLKAEKLIQQLAHGTIREFCDVNQQEPLQNVIVSLEKTSQLFGKKVEAGMLCANLSRLDIPIQSVNDENLIVTSPDWRLDLNIDVDFIEEAARMIGYENFASMGQMARLTEKVPVPQTWTAQKKMRAIMQGLGFYEVCNYGLVSQKSCAQFSNLEICVILENPLSEDQALMRPTLMIELLKNLKQNAAYQKKDIRLFELGSIFQKVDGKFIEKRTLGATFCGAVQASYWKNPKEQLLDFFNLKGIVNVILERVLDDIKFLPLNTSNSSWILPQVQSFLHPFYGFVLELNGQIIGYAGTLHPQFASNQDLPQNVQVLEIDFDILSGELLAARKIVPVLRTPVVRRDCSMILPSTEVSWAKIEEEIFAVGKTLLKSCNLFDFYQKDSLQSISFTLTFQDPENTLQDQTVNELRDKIVANLEQKLGLKMKG